MLMVGWFILLGLLVAQLVWWVVLAVKLDRKREGR